MLKSKRNTVGKKSAHTAPPIVEEVKTHVEDLTKHDETEAKPVTAEETHHTATSEVKTHVEEDAPKTEEVTHHAASEVKTHVEEATHKTEEVVHQPPPHHVAHIGDLHKEEVKAEAHAAASTEHKVHEEAKTETHDDAATHNTHKETETVEAAPKPVLLSTAAKDANSGTTAAKTEEVLPPPTHTETHEVKSGAPAPSNVVS